MKSFKTKRVKIILGAIFGVFVLSTSSVLFRASANNSPVNYSFELLSEYEKNEEIAIPEVEVGGYTANSILRFPSGKTYYNANTAKLSEQGNYCIEYFYNEHGQNFSETKIFTVKNPIAGFLNKDEIASFEYGYDEQTARNGLNLHISPNNTFYYNKELDVSDTSSENPLVEFTFSPLQDGITDAEKIYFTFTDAEDPDNSLTIVVKTRKQSAGWLYLQAKANDQLFSGKDGSTLWIEGNYGCTFQYTSKNESYLKTFNSNANNAETTLLKDMLSKQNVKFWIDNETKEVKVAYYSLMNNDGKTYTTKTITDLDDASFQSSIWEGFKGNKVFLSVKAENFVQDYASIVLTKIGNNSLSTTGYLDESDGPAISVDYGGLDENSLPSGEVGQSYPVFMATANDLYCGSLPYETKVFYNYERSAGIYHTKISRGAKEVSIVNGRFQTDYQGTYAICYSSEDWFGNYTEKVVVIESKNTDSPIVNVVCNNDGDTVGYVGNITEICSLQTPHGGLGNLATVIKVFDANLIEYSVYGNQIDGYYFVPETEGEYTVRYIVSDYVEKRKTTEYKVSVSTSNQTAFDHKLNIDKYLIEGQNYVLPDLIGTNYSTHQTNVKASLTIVDGNGTTQYRSGEQYAFRKDANGYAILKYDDGKNSQVYKRKVISVKDSGNIITSNYFTSSNGITLSKVSQGVNVEIAKNGKIEFINALTDIDVASEIILTDYGTKFDKFTYVLTDSADSTVCVKLSIEKVDGIDCLFLNGELITKNLPLSTSAKITYSEQSFLLNSSLKVAVKNTAFGERFNGFASHKVYISVEFDKVLETGSVIYKKIDNQALNVTRDLLAPVAKFSDIYDNLIAKVNDEVEVKPILYCDVLSGYTFGTVSVYDASGNTVKDVNGIDLKNLNASVSYRFKPTEYENYTIEYVILDQSGKKFTTKRIVQVLDNDAPTLNVGKLKYVQDKGYVKLPNVSANDDSTAAEKIVIYYVVITPDLQMQYVDKEYLYVQTAGEYKLIITAMDEAGNSSSKTVEFIVR